MKKRYLVLMVSILVLLFGCGRRNDLTETKNTARPEKTDIAKEIYWEKKEDLGFQKTSIVHLESNKDNSGLKIVIDGYPVSLENEKELKYQNFNFTKLIKKDFDEDGIMEIVILFYGRSFENFRVIKYDGKTWGMVNMGQAEDMWSNFVEVKALKNSSVKIEVKKTGYKNTVKLPNNKYLKREGEKAVSGTGYHFFELQDNDIIVVHQLYLNNVGDAFGQVRQKIYLDEKGTELVLGETSYMSQKDAKGKKYEMYEDS
mgnify:FL=1